MQAADRRHRFSDRKGVFPGLLAGIALLAMGIRVWYIQTRVSRMPFSGDPFLFYYLPGVLLARGYGYIDPVSLIYGYPSPDASHPPGFVGLIALLYRLGFHSPHSMRIMLSLLGTVSVVGIGLTLSRLVSKRAGLLAALLAACYPNIWLSDTLLLSETLMTFGLVLGLAGVFGFSRRPTWPRLAAAAVGLTIAASARPELLALFGLVMVPLVLARRTVSMGKRVGFLGAAAAIALSVFGPWTLYNSHRFSRPVMTSTGFGQTMMAGNCDLTFRGALLGSYTVKCVKTYPSGLNSPTAPAMTPEMRRETTLVLDGLLQYISLHADLPPTHLTKAVPPLGARRDQSRDTAIFAHEAWKYDRAHWRRLPVVVLAREARTVGLWNPTQQNVQDYFELRGSMRFIRLSQYLFWVISGLAFIGALIWRRRGLILYPFIAVIALTMAVVGVTFGLTRYRAGVEVCLVMLASVSLSAMFDVVARIVRRRPTVPIDPEGAQ